MKCLVYTLIASSWKTESTIGISMTVTATLATKIDKLAAMTINPSKILWKGYIFKIIRLYKNDVNNNNHLAPPPKIKRTRSAILLWMLPA